MDVLGIFAKYWQPGAVMTRLAAALGDQAAASLYRQFLATLIERLADAADKRLVVFAPADRRAEFQSLIASLGGLDRWHLCAQGPGELGDRLKHFFVEAFAGGADRVVVVGSDSPSLPAAQIDRAYGLLGRVPLVLGPTTDGGYYLIGARGGVPPVFDEVPWSTSDVYRATLARAQQAGWACAEIAPWYDVDTIDDLVRLKEELAHHRARSAWSVSLHRAVCRHLSDCGKEADAAALGGKRARDDSSDSLSPSEQPQPRADPPAGTANVSQEAGEP
jgi:rSAM/selenodomain-associated transferase 1